VNLNRINTRNLVQAQKDNNMIIHIKIKNLIVQIKIKQECHYLMSFKKETYHLHNIKIL